MTPGAMRSIGSDLHLTVLSFPKLESRDLATLEALQTAFKVDGAVAICDIRDYQGLEDDFFAASIQFSQLSTAKKKEIKAIGGGEGDYDYLGWDVASDQSTTSDGKTVKDVSKSSVYFIKPDEHIPPVNKWPKQVNLKMPTLALADKIQQVGERVMAYCGIYGEGAPVRTLEGAENFGRIIHYTPCLDKDFNPNWHFPHCDHGLITGLTQARYLRADTRVEEPPGAGLHILKGDTYHKVVAPPGSLLFQIGDFAQLMTSDAVVATRHKVVKPNPPVADLERFTLALFFEPRMDHEVQESTSVLTKDPRYTQHPHHQRRLTFSAWHRATIKNHEVKPVEGDALSSQDATAGDS